MTQTVGTCGNCGGPVTVPTMWGGITPPPKVCERCGATARESYGPTIPMNPPQRDIGQVRPVRPGRWQGGSWGLALILALLAAPAVAEEPRTCFPLATVSDGLATRHGEVPAADGVLESGKGRLVVWANPDTGTWTAAIVTPAGLACMIATGQGWEIARAKVEERAS